MVCDPRRLDAGTPAAASPTVAPAPTVLSIAVGQSARAITAAVSNLFACAEAGNGFALAALARASGSTASDPLWLDGLRRSAPAELVQLANHRADSAGHGSVDVTWRWGAMIRTQHWLLTASGDGWMFASATPLPDKATIGAVGIEVRISGTQIQVSRPKIVNPGVVVLRVTNASPDPVRFAILAVPPGAVISTDLESGPPVASSYAGDVLLAPAERTELAFDALPSSPVRLLFVAMRASESARTMTAIVDTSVAAQS